MGRVEATRVKGGGSPRALWAVRRGGGGGRDLTPVLTGALWWPLRGGRLGRGREPEDRAEGTPVPAVGGGGRPRSGPGREGVRVPHKREGRAVRE